MSWLRQGLQQSISGGINQLKGQIEDILNEGTEEIIDPTSELKVAKDKIKEYERQIELIKIESTRWQEESSELSIKCQTYEAQLNQKADEYRKSISEKDAQIESLKKAPGITVDFADTYQKSALMEDFEELVPQNEFSDYIQLQKEIKRLNEDNQHFINENKLLMNRIKLLEAKADTNINDISTNNLQSEFESKQRQLEITVDEQKQEIFGLQNRLEVDKDKHQQEIIAIQESYKDRTSTQLNEYMIENASLKDQLKDLELKLDRQPLPESSLDAIKISSNKSDDGWCLNDDFDDVTTPKPVKNLQNEELSISKIQTLEGELREANKFISKLQESIIEEKKLNSVQTTTFQEDNSKLSKEIKELKETVSQLENEKNSNVESARNQSQEKQAKLDNYVKEVDSLNLELKQLQESVNQEKLIQITEQKAIMQQLESLNIDNNDLKSKMYEKDSELVFSKNQINELESNFILLKKDNSDISNELQQKTEEFQHQLNILNSEILQLKCESDSLKEQKRQFEFVLDEKTCEISKLKNEIKTHLQHIEAQSKAIEKQQDELTALISKSESNIDENKKLEELTFFKTQYNEIYGYLEQKNVESLNYYNEIQRLNVILSELNRELQLAKTQNETSNEQYENLVKEFQLQQKMVEELNQQTSELNTTLSDTKRSVAAHLQQSDDQQTEDECEKSFESDSKKIDKPVEKLQEIKTEPKTESDIPEFAIEEHNREVINQLQMQIEQLVVEKAAFLKDSEDQIDDLNKKLDQTIDYYEEQLKTQAKNIEDLSKNKQDNDRSERLTKELDRLRGHLVEMSDNYTNEAIQAEEREKQLRLALNDAQKNLQINDENIEISNKELQEKSEKLNQYNQRLKKENELLEEKFNKSESSLNHQIKVTKNLELVLERLQNDQNNQHSMEIKDYQKTIKDQSAKIYNLQRDIKNYQQEVSNMKEALNEIQILDMELKQKEELIKQIRAEIGTKDALIESLEKRFNETQKLNNDFIEKSIIKSLVIGYIKVQKAQEKSQVLKLIGTMLNFTPSEFEQIENATASNWFGLLKSNTPNKSSANQLVTPEGSLNQSFTDLFIQYVDRESKPKPNFTYDTSVSHKKTDGSPIKPNKAKAETTVLSNTSNSTISRNLPSSQVTEDLSNSQTIISSQISSPAAANSFLEQILK